MHEAKTHCGTHGNGVASSSDELGYEIWSIPAAGYSRNMQKPVEYGTVPRRGLEDMSTSVVVCHLQGSSLTRINQTLPVNGGFMMVVCDGVRLGKSDWCEPEAMDDLVLDYCNDSDSLEDGEVRGTDNEGVGVWKQ
ncbi:hypothetical protein NDU88_002392 [Pleurodeles waltl]|uniref:Uncharacterized protein n=1 Tax=Pleurodeles waltl TaxID=8319 RepID=A0AAV7WS73_PLEWA|nr:hypothetical protein NDU88_002392 [Pleurodeles waltl]